MEHLSVSVGKITDNRSCINHNASHHVLKESSTRDLVVLVSLGLSNFAINGLIIFAFFVRRNLRKRPTNMMICSQACTDLFTAFVYIPVYLFQMETLKLFLNCYMLYLSLFNLCIISIDRYLAMNKPFIHRRIINVSRTIKMIICVWVCPLVLTTIPLAWWYGPQAVKEKAMKMYILTMWLLLLIIVVAMSLLYVSASRGAKYNIRSRQASFGSRMKAHATFLVKKETRAVHLFGALLFFFVAAYLPILYINLCWLIDQQAYAPPVLEVISLYLLILNSILNPIICIMLKKDYFNTIKTILLRNSHSGFDYNESSTQKFDRSEIARKNALGSTGHYRQRKTGFYVDCIETEKGMQRTNTQMTIV